MSLPFLISNLSALPSLTNVLGNLSAAIDKFGVDTSNLSAENNVSLKRGFFDIVIDREKPTDYSKALESMSDVTEVLLCTPGLYETAVTPTIVLSLHTLSKSLQTCKRFNPKTCQDEWMFI